MMYWPTLYLPFTVLYVRIAENQHTKAQIPLYNRRTEGHNIGNLFTGVLAYAGDISLLGPACIFFIANHQPLFHLCVNLILFTLLLVHLILRISPHHSHHLRSHHLSLPLPFTPYLKLISFTNPFLHSHSYSFRTAFTDFNQ